MTQALYRDNAYLRECTAAVTSVSDHAVVLDRTVFYPMGGGQPGDTGHLSWDNASATVIDTRHGDDGAIIHHLEETGPTPSPGQTVTAHIDWERRYRHMRMHTCLHLLGAVVKAPVTGGNLTAEKGRLDFDLPEASVDKETLSEALNSLISQDHATALRWITDAELDAQP